MKNSKLVAQWLTALIVIGSFSLANASPAEKHDHDHHNQAKKAKLTGAQKAFEKIKTLAGEWTTVSEGEKSTITFEVVSGGHAVLERIFGMVNVYHLDGDQLMMTHYCSAGNQPRMKAKIKTDDSLEKISLKFLDVTNDHDGSHIRDLDIIFKSDNTVIENWTWRQNGADRTFSATLSRKL